MARGMTRLRVATLVCAIGMSRAPLACCRRLGDSSRNQAIPELTAPVNDFAGVIDAADEAQLDELIRKLQTASGDVIVVATVKTFKPAADIRDRMPPRCSRTTARGSARRARTTACSLCSPWTIGKSGRKSATTSKGIITDGFAGQTSRETMVPFFRQGDYGGGMVAGATVFAQRIAEARNVTLDGVPVRRTRPPSRE